MSNSTRYSVLKGLMKRLKAVESSHKPHFQEDGSQHFFSPKSHFASVASSSLLEGVCVHLLVAF
jgi:alpha/beta superfamily hydrolase